MNRIILIGNGFDLAHGFHTKYEDFINWYWNNWFYTLRTCKNNSISDELCEFTLCDKENTWLSFFFGRINSLNPSTGRDIITQILNKPEIFKVRFKDLFKNICQSIETKQWVDIEAEYYKILNSEPSTFLGELNKEFEVIKAQLTKYLKQIQHTPQINRDLQAILFEPIKINDIAISSRHHLINFLKNRYYDSPKLDMSIGEILGYNQREQDLQELKQFKKVWGEQIDNLGIESIIENDVIPDTLLYPNRIMFLNFNYTNIADIYIPQQDSNEYLFLNNHIHGTLDNNSIIFGYGDELDDNYAKLLKRDDPECLLNIKSIRYLESNAYRTMLQFIESAPFQIYIMGHSCGRSDRTLLNTLFEHRNCVSIKPYYHQKKDGSDNYLDLAQNICRNFTNMQLMRDRVVNKTYCKPLPQISNQED